MGDVDIEKVLVSSKVTFGEKKLQVLIDYLYNGNEVEPLKIILPKTSAYVKRHDGQTK